MTTPVSNLPPVFPPSPPPPAQEWHGTDTSVTHGGNVIVRTDEAWTHFWSEHHPHEPAPDVDFTQNMVVGVFVGSRPAEGFDVFISNIRTEQGSLIVNFREIAPPPGTFAVNVSVHPYALKVIPRSKLPVKFIPVISTR